MPNSYIERDQLELVIFETLRVSAFPVKISKIQREAKLRLVREIEVTPELLKELEEGGLVTLSPSTEILVKITPKGLFKYSQLATNYVTGENFEGKIITEEYEQLLRETAERYCNIDVEKALSLLRETCLPGMP